jgi:hypothetical protein
MHLHLGPSECDLVLTCPKLLTSTEYVPRLQARMAREADSSPTPNNAAGSMRLNDTAALNDAQSRYWTIYLRQGMNPRTSETTVIEHLASERLAGDPMKHGHYPR